MWEALKCDVCRNGLGVKGWVSSLFRIDFYVLVAYRLCVILHRSAAGRVAARFVRLWARALSGCYLSEAATIGGGLRMPHPTGVVVGEGVIVGKDATIFQNVTLGSGDVAAGAYPELGDNVTIFANAVVVGRVRIGDGARIGAGAIVLKDVPAGRTAVGNPARLLPPARTSVS